MVSPSLPPSPFPLPTAQGLSISPRQSSKEGRTAEKALQNTLGLDKVSATLTPGTGLPQGRMNGHKGECTGSTAEHPEQDVYIFPSYKEQAWPGPAAASHREQPQK